MKSLWMDVLITMKVSSKKKRLFYFMKFFTYSGTSIFTKNGLQGCLSANFHGNVSNFCEQIFFKTAPSHCLRYAIPH